LIGELIGKFWSEPANRFVRRLSLDVIFQPRNGRGLGRELK
jgi:hypothetical protein